MTEVRRIAADLQEFYALVADLCERLGGGRILGDATGRDGWPRRGVYFFFETGELRADGATPRVVRVGTHALKAGGTSTLWGRLRAHRGRVGGRAPGGGNHRGSVFRKHVGAALLANGAWPDHIAATWGVGSHAPRDVRAAERPLEVAVSRYIGSMTVLWVPVDDEPGPASDRGLIERGSIALLSRAARAGIEGASANWLGRAAPRPEIGRSALWNVNHVEDPPEPGPLAILEAAVREAR